MAKQNKDFLSEWEDAIDKNRQNNKNNTPIKKKKIGKETTFSHTIHNTQNNEKTTTKEEKNNKNVLSLSPTEKKWLIGIGIVVLLFVILFTFNSKTNFNSPQTCEETLFCSQSGVFIKGTNKPYTGIALALITMPDGLMTKVETKIVNGKPNGEERLYYYPSGQLKMIRYYTNGVFDGKIVSYYESGKIQGELPMSNGLKEGIMKHYYENGQLDMEVPYVNGYENGLLRSYYPNGQLKREIPFINGVENGIGKEYDESGRMKIINYVNGIRWE